MALLFGNVDYESGTIGNSLANGSSGWTSAVGTTKPTYVASSRGSVAMRTASGGTADFPSMMYLFPGLRSTVCVRNYVKRLTSVTAYAIQLQTEAAIRAVLVFNSNGSIRMRSASANLGAAATGTGALNSSTWTRVEWLVTATTQQCLLFTGANVDGTTPDFDTGSIAWTPAGTFDRVSQGIVSTTASVTFEYDDTAVDDTTWVGPTGGSNAEVISVSTGLTLAGVVPTIAAAAGVAAVAAGLTLTGPVPTISAAAGVPATVAPAITLGANAPTITSQTVVTGGGPAAITVAAVAPVVTGNLHANVTGSAAALTLAAPAPAVEAERSPEVVTVAPGVTLVAIPPGITTTQAATVSAVAAGITVNSPAPLIDTGTAANAAAPAAGITAAAVAPAVTAVRAPTVTATPVGITLGAPAPTAAGTATASVAATPAVLTLTGWPPTVATVRVAAVTAVHAAVTAAAYTPDIATGASVNVTTAAAGVTAAARAPIATGATGPTITPASRHIGRTGRLGMKRFHHDPNNRIDYLFDDWKSTDGDVIQSATVTAAGPLTVETPTHDDTTVSVWVSGGVAGTRVLLTCHIVTAGGRQEDRTAILDVAEM